MNRKSNESRLEGKKVFPLSLSLPPLVGFEVEEGEGEGGESLSDLPQFPAAKGGRGRGKGVSIPLPPLLFQRQAQALLCAES